MMLSFSFYPCQTRIQIGLAMLGCLLLGLAGAAEQTTQSSPASPQATPIVGAGAHFSWVIFNDLKPDLERVTGRNITLYGRNSALGLGCNAGIKNAGNYSPAHPTFGFVCCELTDEEVHKKNLEVYPLANEPLLILVNESNPISNLTLQQVRDIFSGKIRNWTEVGGKDKPIVVVVRLHCKNRPGHWKTILPSADKFRKDRLNVKSADDMVKKVTDFSSAIGHTGSTWSFSGKDRVKPLMIDGYAPTAANLAAGKYPFYRTLSAVTIKGVKGDVLTLIREVQQGNAFKSVADKYQLVPLNQN
jgi:ABC-type phosphate transport system substrate-binding protein